MKRISITVVGITLLGLVSNIYRPGPRIQTSTTATTAAWKTYNSRGGWSMTYPAFWEVNTCDICQDYDHQYVFVQFYHRSSGDGWVEVESWFEHTATAPYPLPMWIAKLNISKPWVSQRPLILNGLIGLDVVANGFESIESETVYLAAGRKMFSVKFVGRRDGPVADQRNYSIYRRMLETFQAR